MALTGTEIVIQKLEARLRLHLWQSNECIRIHFWVGEGIQCVGRQEGMQSPEERSIYLLQLAQPQSSLHTNSSAVQSPYSLLSKPNACETHCLLQHKFRERFYNASLCFDSGSNWEGLCMH